MDTGIASTFWLLWLILLEHGCINICLCPCIHFFWVYTQSKIARPHVILCLIVSEAGPIFKNKVLDGIISYIPKKFPTALCQIYNKNSYFFQKVFS